MTLLPRSFYGDVIVVEVSGDLKGVAIDFQIVFKDFVAASVEFDFASHDFVGASGSVGAVVFVGDAPRKIAFEGSARLEFEFRSRDDESNAFHVVEEKRGNCPFASDGVSLLGWGVVLVFFAAVEARQNEQEQRKGGQVNFREKGFHA